MEATPLIDKRDFLEEVKERTSRIAHEALRSLLNISKARFRACHYGLSNSLMIPYASVEGFLIVARCAIADVIFHNTYIFKKEAAVKALLERHAELESHHEAIHLLKDSYNKYRNSGLIYPEDWESPSIDPSKLYKAVESVMEVISQHACT